jgi:MFS family permease
MSNKVNISILILIFIVSFYSITIFLKPQDIFSNSPIYTDDYSMHFSHCLSTKRFLLSEGKCWGYDPFFLAGYPSGALVDADNKGWEMFFFIFSPLSEGFAFKLYLILFLLLYPFFLYGAARNFNLSETQSLLASLLGVLYFYLSLAADFIYWGMLSYTFMCFFSLYIFSLFYKLFERFSWKRYLILTFLSSLLLLMHILSPVHLFIPILILYFLNFKKLSPAHHLLMVLMGVVILLANSYWLIPTVQFFDDKTARPENYNFSLQIDSISEFINVYVKQKISKLYRRSPELNNTFMDVILLLLGICGFFTWWKEKKTQLFLPFFAGVFVTCIIAYYGSHTDFFPQLQPQRFTLPLNIFLIIPGSVGMLLVLQNIFKGKDMIATLFIFALVFVFLFGPVVKPLNIIYREGLYRMNCEFPALLKDLLTWVEENTTRKGRILIEDSEYTTSHQYYGGHLPALFPEYVKREFLCGPRPMYPIKHSYASFTAGLLFEKKTGDYSLDDLQQQFNLYNVKWIVCWSEESKKVFSQFPGYILKLKEIDKFSIYQVNREPSFFLKGKGLVKSDYNRLELSQIVSQDSEVIISYHWMKYFKTNPARKLERVFVGDDPVGFIRIVDPPKSLVIYNGY